MGRDITTTFNAWSHNAAMVREIYAQTQNEVPINSIELTLPKAIFSVAKRFSLNPDLQLLTVMDLNFSFDGKRQALYKSTVFNVDPSIGAELAYKETAYFRVGAGNFQRLENFDGTRYTSLQPGFGLGFRVSEEVLIDYALTDIGSVSETPFSHVFSIKVSLNPLKEDFRIYGGWERN